MAKETHNDSNQGSNSVSNHDEPDIEAVAEAIEGADDHAAEADIDTIAAAVSEMTGPDQAKPSKEVLPAPKAKTETKLKSRKSETAIQPKVRRNAPAKKPVAAAKPAPIKISKTKDTNMIDKNAEKATETVTQMADSMQGRMRSAYEKSNTLVAEMADYSRGNVEAAMESARILAEGVQTMGRETVEESKSAYETMAEDMRKLAAAKSPTEFLQLQGEFFRRSIDTAVTQGSKNTEAFLRLTNEAFAPVSNRMSVAMDRVAKAA